MTLSKAEKIVQQRLLKTLLDEARERRMKQAIKGIDISIQQKRIKRNVNHTNKLTVPDHYSFDW